MADYICPYCGGLITAESVLFVDEDVEATYEDSIRHQFLSRCCKSWPFYDDTRFRGLYFQATPDRVMKRDKNDFPIMLRVLPSEGQTPSELLGQPRMDEENKKPLNNGFTRLINTRVCPNCHCRLPSNFGIIPTIYVTMLGGRAAGKTAYLISLVHRLASQLTTLNLGSARLLNESETYYNYLNENYQKTQGVGLATPKEELLFPFIFEYSYLNGSEPKRCFVAIYDIAGEGTDNPNYLLNHHGIKVASTVLLMLDPNQLNGGLYGSEMTNLQSGGAMPAMSMGGDAHDTCKTDVGAFLSNSVLSNRDFGILSNVKHVIAVTTKIDQPMTCKKELFGGQCILREDIGVVHKGRLDQEALRRVRDDLQIFYRREGHGIDIIDTIKAVFNSEGNAVQSVDLLAVSTWTRDKSSSELRFENKYEETGAKHRIVEPFLLILARAGMIPVGKVEEVVESDDVKRMREEMSRNKKEITQLEAEIRSGNLRPREIRRKQKDIDRLQNANEVLKRKIEKQG